MCSNLLIGGIEFYVKIIVPRRFILNSWVPQGASECAVCHFPTVHSHTLTWRCRGKIITFVFGPQVDLQTVPPVLELAWYHPSPSPLQVCPQACIPVRTGPTS